MELSKAQQQALDDLTEKLKRDPLANPLLLADLTQLRANCDFLVSLKANRRLRGALAVTRHLPLTAIAFSDMTAETFVELMGQALELPQCRSGIFCCLASSHRRNLIKCVSFIRWEIAEFRFGLPGDAALEPFTAQLDEGLELRELSIEDADAVVALYDEVPAVAFGRKAMELGPWVGIFSGEDLIGVAGVHFSTPWVTEIGHAAVHSEFRRMGCARALLSRQIQLLTGKTKHILACCFQENLAPQNLLESMGFRRHEQVWLMEFSVG